ncbi:MAG: hypothetical protein PVI90_07275 [Desulfobacteraceae bacterium]|jgi:hypothetical protein
MRSKILFFLAITVIACVSAMALISDVHTDSISVNTDSIAVNKVETIKENIDVQEEEEDTVLSNSNFPKSKLTLAILLLGGVGLAVFRRNNLM